MCTTQAYYTLVHDWFALTTIAIALYTQCCKRRSIPAELGYFETACRSNNCRAGGVTLLGIHHLSAHGIFFPFKFASFLSIQGVFSLLNGQEHFFHQF